MHGWTRLRYILGGMTALLSAALVAGMLGRNARALTAGGAGDTVALPAGVHAEWSVGKAYRESTTTRERICLNGLWRWQPTSQVAAAPPTGQWGFFKVPGFWPGNTEYMHEDSQTLYANPGWKDTKLGDVTAAWYQREVTVPAGWNGRRVGLYAEYVNSLASVFVDGTKAGDIRFPAGEVDITKLCRPGGTHLVSLLVLALPLKSVVLSYKDTNSATLARGSVERRGLCGDLYLVSEPEGPAVTEVSVATSVRQGQISVSAVTAGLAANVLYTLHAEIRDGARVVHEMTSPPFQAGDLKGSRVTLKDPWKPEKLWDVNTPENLLEARASLVDAGGKVVDAYYPVRFGFREFWIDGRDFYLNGTRIFISALPLENAAIGARTATYAAARATMERLQSIGINFVYTHNYDCEPGSHVSFEEILRAADDVGMLVSFTQPHFSSYDWKAPDADRSNGYARDAGFYVHVAENHPSVVAYAMSHNATGYDEDMNPDLIDGTHDPRDAWSKNNVNLALRAEAIVKGLDPTRIVYHHASGNLGSMHDSNFYLNFAPIQEVSGWFEHWATVGVKPLFLCEYGVPYSWDWTMYRGWYKGKREWGSARVPWEYCLAEWDAQFLGDKALKISADEKENLRWEARHFRAGETWYRWDYPHAPGAADFDDQQAVWAMYITDNWRAFRTWGVSGNSPSEYSSFWKLAPGVNRQRQALKVDWDDLQKPGFSPDDVQPESPQFSVDFDRAAWLATPASEALLRNNRPLLAYIGGKSGQFTSKDHNFYPGETVEKQIIVINNSRQTVSSQCDWSLALPQALTGTKQVSVPTGQQARIPISFRLPAELPAGAYVLTATVKFSTGETQNDSFTIQVLARPRDIGVTGKMALWDPKGETARMLDGMGVAYQAVRPDTDLSAYDVLIVGKAAFTPDGPGPDVLRVRDGLKVVMFEQTAQALEHRFGFRTIEYGLRRVFPRVQGHPVLAGLTQDQLCDWRGDATLVPPRLDYTLRPEYGPRVEWCGLEVPQVWRAGCTGNVASVLIEKPACGDFLPIVDGGFGLQFSPLLEYHEGRGMVLLCQMDVTGRTEGDPAAEILARNLLRYVAAWKPVAGRKAVYVGEAAGKAHLEAAGFAPGAYDARQLTPDDVLIVGPGGGKQLAADGAALRPWLQGGGHIVAVGLDAANAQALPGQVTMKNAEHIGAELQPFAVDSPFAGVSPGDVLSRDPRNTPLVAGGAKSYGDGILAQSLDGHVAFCQFVPWQFDAKSPMNQKRTFRRASVLLARVLSDAHVAGATPLLDRFHRPVAAKTDQRWLQGLYLDVPVEWDDPYRFFRW